MRVNGSSWHSPINSNLAATCKTITKTTEVIRRPSDGKVSLFWKILSQKRSFFRLGMRTFFGVTCFPFIEGDRRSNFSGGWTISSLNGKRSWLLFRKGGFVSFVCNYFPDRAAVESASLFFRRRRSQFMSELSFVR